MSAAEIIPFDFEEQAVRVVMRGDDPWFVAADVCRVLEIANPSDALSRLDDDETDMVNLNTLGNTEGIRGNPNARLVNESGLYALVLTSRKEAARRFRKWITAQVLPAIRRHGRYDMPAAPAGDAPGTFAGLPLREAELWLQAVREARLTRGTRAAVTIWDRSPLPPLSPPRGTEGDPAEGRACLDHLLAELGPVIAAAPSSPVDALAPEGLRRRAEGLFVANFALPVFSGTRWAGGAHRAALLALPGVAPLPASLTLANVATRGVIVPWPLTGAEG